MADFYKNTPLPIYNAIFYNNFEYYADVLKTLDYLTTEDNEYYNLASVIDIDINQMNSYSNLYIINTLNYADIIIEQLDKFINGIDKESITNLETLNHFLKKLENSLKEVDYIFSKILTFEIRSQFFKQQDEIMLLDYSIQDVKKNNIPYAEQYIDKLNDNIKENENYKKNIKSKLYEVYYLLKSAKEYIDIYYGTQYSKDDTFDKHYKTQNSNNVSTNFLYKSMFNFCIPKHYIRLCIVKNEKLIESMEAWAYAIRNKNLSKEFFNNKLYNVEVYEIHTISDYINVSLNHLLRNYNSLKKCHNCNKYFIPQNRADEVYCSRISPQNPKKTCKEYGAKKAYRDEIKSKPLKNEHNKTSQFYRMRINRARDEKEEEFYQKRFNTYKENYQNKKELYKSGKLKEADFIEWIINQKEGVKSGSTRNNKK